jgi:hypothetical protein
MLFTAGGSFLCCCVSRGNVSLQSILNFRFDFKNRNGGMNMWYNHGKAENRFRKEWAECNCPLNGSGHSITIVRFIIRSKKSPLFCPIRNLPFTVGFVKSPKFWIFLSMMNNSGAFHRLYSEGAKKLFTAS